VTRRKHLTHTVEETQALGEALGGTLGPGAVVACVGDLGTGKTAFLQGVARGLGVPSPVTSPTFVLVNVYRGRLPVHHLDAYRTDSLSEILELGLEEMLDGEGVTFIEWADKMLPLLPARTVVVRISGAGDEPREIEVEEPGAGD
jgi:tRNA threonylcarbamoyladenosine biosynthesis protein TsaE